jgi:glucosyl-dolichyl phosphate glucuronosyltransferase
MQHIESYLDRNREKMGLPAQGRIFVELHAPASNSRLHRLHYRVRVGSEPNYSVVIQNDRSLEGHLCRVNPYEPYFAAKVAPLLVPRRGAFSAASSRYYWAEYMKGQSLLDQLRNDRQGSAYPKLLAIAERILAMQAKCATRTPSAVASLCDLIQDKIDEPKMSQQWRRQAAPLLALTSSVPQHILSWSHGDLWPMEIFGEADPCILIDWEWAHPEAPLGVDLIDLYLNTAQHALGASYEESWIGLLDNSIHALTDLGAWLRSSLVRNHPDRPSVTATLLYGLLRWWGREVAQEGPPALSAQRSERHLGLAQRISGQTNLTGRSATAIPCFKTPRPVANRANYTGLPILSIIIPTFNRSRYLQSAIESIASQQLDPRYYEILVVDNGSTDSTKNVVCGAGSRFAPHRIRYLYEPIPGLLSGRHRGALEAQGDYLCFVDDDIIAADGWLDAIIESFARKEIHLVGGPSLPLVESRLPPWAVPYCHMNGRSLMCGAFSLIDLGDRAGEIDPVHVWGLNYSIRKSTLFELGGFHPDNIPKHLQCFQGDGETGLSLKIKEKGYKAYYHPLAKVYHHIPSDRFTQEYFEQRHFYQGVCDSFTAIRKAGSASHLAPKVYDPDEAAIPKQDSYQFIHQAIRKAYIDGYNFHLSRVKQTPELLNWVLKTDYFDYRLPPLQVNAISS